LLPAFLFKLLSGLFPEERMKRALLAAGLLIIAVSAAACGSDEPTPAAGSQATIPVLTPTSIVSPEDFRFLEPGEDPRPPTGGIDQSKTYIATIKTEKGDIAIQLLDDIAPLYVENFINLARIGYYDGTTFHRVLEDFMAQGGDPTGTGGGSPGYRFADQFHPDMKHDGPGVLSMANAGLNTNGSQFFITFVETPHLDPYDASGNLKSCQIQGVSCHAVFGHVIDEVSMEVVRSIRLRDPSPGVPPGDQIDTIEIQIFDE
jgi:cyclophilin family peptidyl-prolyl cis-trans isomerase